MEFESCIGLCWSMWLVFANKAVVTIICYESSNKNCVLKEFVKKETRWMLQEANYIQITGFNTDRITKRRKQQKQFEIKFKLLMFSCFTVAVWSASVKKLKCWRVIFLSDTRMKLQLICNIKRRTKMVGHSISFVQRGGSMIAICISNIASDDEADLVISDLAFACHQRSLWFILTLWWGCSLAYDDIRSN